MSSVSDLVGIRTNFIWRDRNWLNFLSILNATFSHVEKAEHIHKTEKLFHDLAQLDGNSDRSSLLALLELKKRTREANIPEHNVSEYNGMSYWFRSKGNNSYVT